jgi:hypothetical protein
MSAVSWIDYLIFDIGGTKMRGSRAAAARMVAGKDNRRA